MGAILYYVHDPMCSWCWGYRPTWQALRARMPAGIVVKNLLGGLAPDSEEPMPATLQAAIQGHWRRIAAELGTEFNFDFWTACRPKRSTYPACRAVIAARRQQREEDMIRAIQHAYYRRAMNPSETQTLRLLAAELGLDGKRFSTDLDSAAVNEELLSEVALAKRLPIHGFPSLVIRSRQRDLPVALDYRDPRVTLDSIDTLMRQAG